MSLKPFDPFQPVNPRRVAAVIEPAPRRNFGPPEAQNLRFTDAQIHAGASQALHEDGHQNCSVISVENRS